MFLCHGDGGGAARSISRPSQGEDDDEDERNDWQLLLWLAAFSLTFCDSTRAQ